MRAMGCNFAANRKGQTMKAKQRIRTRAARFHVPKVYDSTTDYVRQFNELNHYAQ